MKSLNRVNCKLAHEPFANKTITNHAIPGFFMFQVLHGTRFLQRHVSLGFRFLQTPGNSRFQVSLGCGSIRVPGNSAFYVNLGCGCIQYKGTSGF